ncbi:class E sortase [Streptomyces sp. NPDC054933]
MSQRTLAARWGSHRRGVIAAGIATAFVLSATAVVVSQSSKGPQGRSAPASTRPTPSVASPSARSAGGSTTTATRQATQALDDWANHNSVSTTSTTSGPGGSITDVVRIPALGRNWAQPVYQGTSPEQLRSGLGHFDGTEAAGQIGNFVLAGHRSGIPSPPLRNIDSITPGASITVSTPQRITYTYTVTSISTVDPTDVAVTAQVPGHPSATPTKAMLTLVTCWPADGHSKRVVVEAALTSSRGGEL